MAEHLTEEEQIERLKRWWADYGRAIVIGIALAVAGYFGWQAWQSQQQQERQGASLVYEELTRVVATGSGETLTEDQRTKAASLAEELKSDYGNLLYASDAALLMARVAVQQGDLEQAERELRWVLDQNHNEELNLLARLRLAQVLHGQGEHQEALTLLAAADDPGAYAAVYAELRGDTLVAQGKTAEARAAYQTAMEKLLPAQDNRRDLIQMKMDNLQDTGGDNSDAEADS